MAESMYHPLKSRVQIMNPKNFEKQVTNNREKGISIVQFYKDDDENSKRDQGPYESFAIEHEKMFRIGSVECNEWSKICSSQGITQFPSYKVYPPHPIPAMDYTEPENVVDTDKLKKMAYKFIGSRVIELTSANIETF